MKLTLNEIVSLNFELNGMSIRSSDGDEQKLTKGLLAQKMSFKTKLYLQRLNKIISEEVKLFEDSRNELIKKLEGDELQKEYDELINAEKNLDTTSIWGLDLTIDALANIETDEVYPVFMRLIDGE